MSTQDYPTAHSAQLVTPRADVVMYVKGQEFTEQYMVEYQREDQGRWFRFHNRRGHEVSSLQYVARRDTLTSLNKLR